jgi:hypothetical protein
MYILHSSIHYIYILHSSIHYIYILHSSIHYIYILHSSIHYIYILHSSIHYMYTLHSSTHYMYILHSSIHYIYILHSSIHYIYILRGLHTQPTHTVHIHITQLCTQFTFHIPQSTRTHTVHIHPLSALTNARIETLPCISHKRTQAAWMCSYQAWRVQGTAELNSLAQCLGYWLQNRAIVVRFPSGAIAFPRNAHSCRILSTRSLEPEVMLQRCNPPLNTEFNLNYI